MNRVDIFLGTKCNNNCIFCCSKENDKNSELTFAEVKVFIDKAFQQGAREVHFTGSEPTIRQDIFKIVKYSKEKGYQRIKMTTNGRMLSYNSFTEMLVKSGLNSIIFSVHSHNEELNEKLTGIKGGFSQMMQGLSNIKKYKKMTIDSNTAIVKQNYMFLEKISRMLVSFDFNSSELIFVHPKGKAAKNYCKVVPRLIEIEPHLIRALEIGKRSKKVILSRYIPYCFLGIYTDCASENFEPLKIIQYGQLLNQKDSRKRRRDKGMKKSLYCKKCMYDLICMGIHKEHKYDIMDFKPVFGRKIKTRDVLLEKFRLDKKLQS